MRQFMIEAIIDGHVVAVAHHRSDIRNEGILPIISGYRIVLRKHEFSIYNYLWMVEQYSDGKKLIEIRYYDYNRPIIWGKAGRPVPNSYQTV